MSFDEHPFDSALLRTAFVPDESQSRPINAAIVAQREAIEAIDSQISELEQRIVDLRKNRHDISEKLACNEAFLAPVRRLAPEILREIFGHCLPHEPAQNTAVPLSLTGVCHSWRRMVQETPQLWVQVYVDSKTRLSLVEKFLRNSMIFPLDVTVELRGYKCERTSGANGPPAALDHPWAPENLDQATIVTETTEIIRVISEQHRRIRRLRLHSSSSILSVFFPSRFRMKTSLLEELTLRQGSTSWFPLNFASRFQLKGGRLRTLTLDGDAFFLTSINHTFGLRRMYLQGAVSVSKFLQFLRVSPALEELTMKDFRPCHMNELADPEFEHEPVFLAKLSLLEMDWDERGWDTQGAVRESLLKTIRTPAVRSVIFSRYDLNMDDLYTFLAWCAQSLLRLSLDRLTCNPYQFFRMLRGLCALEVLYIADQPMYHMWEPLIPEKDAAPSGWICPTLTALELRGVDVESNFLEFVRRRTKPIQSETIQDGFHYLKSVSISYSFFDQRIRTTLQNLQSQREDFSFELHHHDEA